MTSPRFPLLGALALLVLLFGACTYQTQPAAAPTVIAQMQAAATREVVAVLYSDGSWATVTPDATATPSPTATVTPTFTATFPVSDTPIPSDTPFATPTIEDTRTPTYTPPPTNTATVTATPTITPAPDAKCWGTITAGSLNVRVAPWSDILGQVHAGDILTFDARWFADFWWWRIEWWDGSVDDYIGAYVSSNWIEVGDTANCDDLPDATPAPIIEALHGPHIISADAANVLLNYCDKFTTVKLFQGTMGYASAFRACNPDIWIVCRFWTDDIARESDYDAFVTYERIGRGFPNDCDAVEPENEKAPINAEEWQAWGKWAKDFAALMAERRNMQVLVLGLGPGWPAFTDLQYIEPYLRWVAENPLDDGRYHGISSHASPYAPYSRADQPWLSDPYIAGRVYMMRDWLYATTPDNFDLYEWPGVWFISELGLSDGYSGSWTAPYSCDEARLSYWETQDKYTVMGFPLGFVWWNFGEPWTDDTPCAVVVWG